MAMGRLVFEDGKRASESRQGRKEIAAAVAKEGVLCVCLTVYQTKLLIFCH
jgi:hypothetical protein